MTGFKGFSEAAKLYAKNIDVVREMEKTYNEDVDACRTLLEASIGRVVAPHEFSSSPTKAGYRYWRLGHRRADPYLWVRPHNPDEFDHDGIVLTAAIEGKGHPLVEPLTQLCKRPALGLEVIEGGDNDNIFSLSIEFRGKNFIDKTAHKVAVVLKAMETLAAANRSRKRPAKRRR